MTAKIASVGRKRRNDTSTADSGSSVRGKAVFRTSRPPFVTDRPAWLSDVLMKL